MMRLKKNNTEYSANILVTFMLILAVILYNFVWLNRSFTLSEGWARVYVEMIDEGKVPYGDFYYFLPVFSLGVDYVFWKLSFGYFIIFRCFRLAERVLITLLMYKIINKKLSRYISAIICFCGTIMASGNVYDLVGDYNQTVQLLIVLLIFFLLKYFGDESKNKKWLFLSGIIGGLMFGTKQTVILASAIVFTLLFIILYIIKEEKSLITDFIVVLSGAIIPIFILTVYLILTHSLSDYIYYNYKDIGSKGGLYDIVISSQLGIIKNRIAPFIAIILILCNKILSDFFEYQKYTRLFKSLCMIASISLLLYNYIAYVMYAGIAYVKSLHFLVVLGVIFFIIYFTRVEWVYPIVLLVYSGLMICNLKGSTEEIYNSGIFNLIQEFMSVLYIYIVCWLIYNIMRSVIKNKKLQLDNIILACGTIASAFSTSMAATGTSSTSTIISFIGVPTLLYIEGDCLMYNSIENDDGEMRLDAFIKIAVLIVLSICLSQKLVCCYAWWGDTEGSFWSKSNFSNIECLKGFRFTDEEIEKYDMLYEVMRNNSDEESFIFSFPYTKVYNIFLNNYNTETFASVFFYDVCPDDVAISDAEILAEKNPDIIVWLDIPSCMEIHETLFRGGKRLGQREIQKWFSSVKDYKYTLIGQVDNVYIYKLNDGTEITTTYIKDKNAKNETAAYSFS